MVRAGSLRSRFVVFDGPDGSGKSTVLQEAAGALRAGGHAVTTCKDPGGTAIGDRIRSVLLDHDLCGMDPVCETLLFMASRAQLVREVVRPALARGDVVLCDRFVSATCAYQVAAGCALDRILALAQQAVGASWPDLTLVLDVPVELGLTRVRQRRSGQANAASASDAAALDSMERRPAAFHECVRRHFLELPESYPAPVSVLDARGPVADVVAEVLQRLGALGRSASSARLQRAGALA